MRAIDGDALRDRLQSLGYDDWNQGVTTTWAEAFSECADMVEDVPTIEPEPHWIPCSERMPDSKEYVLVTEYGETNIGRRFDGRWVDYYGDKLKDVSAWMPLPEPYKEENDDEC